MQGRLAHARFFTLCATGFALLHCRSALLRASSGETHASMQMQSAWANSSSNAAPAPPRGDQDRSLGAHKWKSIVRVEHTTQEAVQRALDLVHEPTIVVLPPGDYSISGVLDVHADDVLLVGAGSDATILRRPASAGSAGEAPFVRAQGVKRFQLSGVGFEGDGTPDSQRKDIGVRLEDLEDFRIDHCRFSKMGFAGVRVAGRSRGVIDHSYFHASYKQAIGTDGYGVAVYGTDAITGIPMGTSNAAAASFSATFIEDCEFSLCRHAVASNKGARYVFRRNHVTKGVIAHAVDAHGAEYGSDVGTEWIDVYENTLEQTEHTRPFYDGWAVRIRGGKGLVHDNTIVGYTTGVELTEQTREKTGPVYVWNNTVRTNGAGVEGTQVHLGRRGEKSPPVYALTPLPGYVPHAYPHPLALGAAACRGKALTQVGWATVCPTEDAR